MNFHINDILHNRKLHKQWLRDGKPVLHTTIGWRPNPVGGEDGFVSNGDGSYSRIIRGGTAEYRARKGFPPPPPALKTH